MNKVYFLLLIALTAFAGCHTKKQPAPPINGVYYYPPDDSVNFTKFLYKNGIIIEEQPFKNNRIDGLEKRYYENGTLRQTIEFVDAKRNGMTTLYYESGDKHSETPYKDGKEEGVQKMYRKDGALALESPYSDGLPVPPLKEYDDKGGVIEQPKLILSASGAKLSNKSFTLETLYRVEGDNVTKIEDLKGVKKGVVIRAVYKTPRGAEGAVDAKY